MPKPKTKTFSFEAYPVAANAFANCKDHSFETVPKTSKHVQILANPKTDWSVLAGFKKIETLSIASAKGTIKEACLEHIAACTTLKHLEISYIETNSFELLAPLKNLESLSLNMLKNGSLVGIEKLKLQTLLLFHCVKITDIEPIGKISSLRTLMIDTAPSWDSSSKKLVVDSFEPLGRLKKLEALRLQKTIPTDGSIRPLAACKELKHINILNDFPIEELAYLAKHLKKIEDNSLKPVGEELHIECKKCKSPMVLLNGRIGKRSPKLVCTKCDVAKIEKQRQVFNEALIAAGK